MKFVDDTYKQSRGKSHFLEIICRKCGAHICFYQKDGPGNLRRMYIDRMRCDFSGKELKCAKCDEVLGTKIIYEKENRPAYRLYVDAVMKKVISSKLIK